MIGRVPADVAAALRADPSLVARVRAIVSPPSIGQKITGAAEFAALVRPFLVGQETERLVAVAMDRRCRLVDVEVLTIGCDAFTVVDPRQIYRWALTRSRVVSLVGLAHNHPSGDPCPSSQDRDVTRRVAVAGRVLGLQLFEHMVITDDEHRSMAAEGLLGGALDDVPWTTS